MIRPDALAAGDRVASVMVCDDSAVIRAAVTRMLETDPEIRVVARVRNGAEALAALPHHAVDVLVLDIEMPVMDGLTALPLLLREAPSLRIVMASTLTTRGADTALRALRLGAADYVPKPGAGAIFGNDAFREELLAKVRGLARLRRRLIPGTVDPAAPAPRLRPAPAALPRLLAIGSSTGGPQALFTLVQGLGPTLPVPVVLTQHMPRSFTPILAEHITRLGGLPCAEAQDGETLLPGRIYLAPGDRHLLVRSQGRTQGRPLGGALLAELSEGPPENFCRPAVDPMLRSATLSCEGRVLAVILTGMGQDGLKGTEALIAAGGCALAQDEATSVVWGMPGAVARAGLCHAVLPLPALAPKIRDMLPLQASGARA